MRIVGGGLARRQEGRARIDACWAVRCRAARPYRVRSTRRSSRVLRSAAWRDHPVLTWPASLPAAAVRVLRIAAGRRALQLVLVAGGLLAIGLLGGERAYAADGPGGVPVGTSSVSATSAVSATSGASSVSSSASASDELRSSVQGTVERLLSPPAKPTAPATKPTAPPATPTTPDAQPKPGAHDESTAPPADPAPEDHRPQPEVPRTQPHDQPAQTHTPGPPTTTRASPR